MTNDRLPGARVGILAMCRVWIAYMTVQIRLAWGIPDAEFTELENLFSSA
jgi:hypothetical protein